MYYFCFRTIFNSRWFFRSINSWLDYFLYIPFLFYFFAIFTKFDCLSMSVHADGLMRKAHRQMKDNYKQTGLYETNIQRQKREKRENGR